MEWTPQEIANKIDYEGGLNGFFHWAGLTRDQVPSSIYPEYALAEQAWRDFVRMGDQLMKALPEPGAE